MGYSTDFEGSFMITPPLEQDKIVRLNDFCNIQHDEDAYVSVPSQHCNYEVGSKGNQIYWNGHEKSYCMEKWIRLLIGKFFIPWERTLNGHMLAQGESLGDIWKLEVKDNVVCRKELPKLEDW